MSFGDCTRLLGLLLPCLQVQLGRVGGLPDVHPPEVGRKVKSGRLGG